jgi:hypothetical protein
MDGLLIAQDLQLKLLHLTRNLLPAIIRVRVSLTCLVLNFFVSGVVTKIVCPLD